MLNLVLSVLGVMCAGVAVVRAPRRGKQAGSKAKPGGSKEVKQVKRYRNLWLVTAVILGIAGVVLFAQTQDLGGAMRLADLWTLVQAGIFAVETLAITFLLKSRQPDAK